ncbi:hypothetical protein BCR37DRAFT_127087 [Protomyces lactucae-debilis]|uniref:Uncharacterized protein n=1 Tax=Protomyces lactucae-debilis TaxID=2754530 RepID=A0A1Y2FU72_PROLT|nr:uncharacterized protein BCR37DRAFT_127087 [Protomyces lactucae-debilis]ORY86844.1 hypothetical protein BCR37DRAFT_127087 [Protomyces lactucae-debilis]
MQSPSILLTLFCLALSTSIALSINSRTPLSLLRLSDGQGLYYNATSTRSGSAQSTSSEIPARNITHASAGNLILATSVNWTLPLLLNTTTILATATRTNETTRSSQDTHGDIRSTTRALAPQWTSLITMQSSARPTRTPVVRFV